MQRNRKKIAVYPGTFDPVTIGHTDIIRRASKLFDNLIIAVADNSQKKPFFSINERIEMMSFEISDMGITNCSIIKLEGLLVDFAQRQSASAVIRGLRALSDFEYEFRMAYMNAELNPEIETIFIPATNTGHFISSSFVKEISRLGGKIDNFVSKYVENKLKSKEKSLAE